MGPWKWRPMSLCLFDLDNTLVEGRTIERLSRRFDRPQARDVAAHRDAEEPAAGAEESARIIRFFEGIDAARFAAACADADLREGAEEAVQGLRALGFKIGVASASYLQAAKPVVERLGLDFAVAAEPEIRDGRLTGRLMPSRFQGACGTFICKEAVLASHDAGPPFKVAVGDGHNDTCMLQAADLGIALEPCPVELRLMADVSVHHLAAIPALVARHMTAPPKTRPT